MVPLECCLARRTAEVLDEEFGTAGLWGLERAAPGSPRTVGHPDFTQNSQACPTHPPLNAVSAWASSGSGAA